MMVRAVACTASRLVLFALVAALGCACDEAATAPQAASTPPKAQQPARASSNTVAVALPVAREPDRQDTVNGYQVIRAKTKDGASTTIEVVPPVGWEVVEPPTEPDPHAGKFTLKQATAGLAGSGMLTARIQTSLGSFYCDLFEDKAPNTVANFVGLARGKRKYWDEVDHAWVARPFYAGTSFHKVIPGAFIHGGDRAGTGRGRIGYVIPDEVHPSLSQDRAGRLCMAQRRANSNDSQFFITETASPHFEGRFSIFGQCQPTALVQRIARVPQSGPPEFRVLTPVAIQSVEVKRVAGGATAWMPKGAAEAAAVPGVAPAGKAVQVDEGGGDL